MTDVRSALQNRIAALSPQQRELLERRLAEHIAERGPVGDDRIPARDRTRPTPLAIQQQREWTFGQYRAANNIPGAFRVVGDFDRELLGRVLTRVTERHEVLRSTVEQRADGSHVQVTHPVTPVPVPLDDLTHLPEDEQEQEIRRRWEAEVVTPFDPAQRQRLRIALLRLGTAEHVVLITTDHAAADLVSMGILVQEFATLYETYRHGGGQLPPVEVQYGDFAAWQRDVESQHLAAEKEHWRRELADVPAGLALPSDRPYPTAPTFAGGVLERPLSPELVTALRRFGEQERASLGVVLFAACAVLLHRYTGRTDLVVGEVVSGRNRPEIERIIGCFVGMLPIRVQCTPGTTLRELVRRARSTVVTAYGHQDVPVDGFFDQLGLADDVSSALVDMWLDVRTPPTSLEVPGLHIAAEPMHSSLAASPLTLGANPDADRLTLQWLYMTEMFDEDTVVLLATQFERVLAALVGTPDGTVADVELAVGTTGTVRPSATDTPSFVELFRRRVATAPHAPAVRHDGRSISYAELDAASDELARRLVDRGAGSNSTVGIRLEQTPLLAVAVLGVLKSGAAYVPLDVAYPPQRSAQTLADADCLLLVTRAAQASYFDDAGLAAPPTLFVDEADTTVGDTGLPTALDPSSAAYVVYTSGSTGRPKGVVIEHRSLAVYARDVVDHLGLGSGDRFLQFASPGFDVLAEELFPTWLAGGCVVFPPRPLVSAGADITDVLERAGVSVVELPTAFWHEWTRELVRSGRALPDRLRLVIIGGERVLPDCVAMWGELGGTLVHVYGVTETTVSSTFFRWDATDPVRDWSNLPVGTAIPSADLRVLDHRLAPVPLGATGELYVGGVSLARGYHGRPGLTAERFVADPDGTGDRLYRTGDLVRIRPAGGVEFVSRVDDQVKIRGHRIEPAEVEAALDRHPLVVDSVVTSYEPTAGDQRLVAYLVAREDASPPVGELRRFLERDLPRHMVPSAFVTVDALPLTANGKIDRSALPVPEGTQPDLAAGYAPPETPVQRQLVTVLAEVVGVDRVGIHDNFFEIGGDSILAIRVVARAKELGLRLSPYDVFANPTPADLAAVARVGPVIDAEQGDVAGPVPLAPTQWWFCTAGIEDAHHWNISMLLEPREPVAPDALRSAVEHVLAQHDGLRQRFLLSGSRSRLRIAPRGDATPFEVHDLGAVDAEDDEGRMRTIVDRAQRSLDLAVGPLVRAVLVRSDGRADRLLVVAHRLVVDDDSMRLLLDDLSSAVRQVSDGRPVRMPAKTTSWQAWVRRLVRYGRDAGVRAQRAYWTSLAEAPAGRLVGNAPAARPAPQTDRVADARVVSTALRGDETDRLLSLPEKLNCTVPELLLAALARLLHEWTGADRHVVDYHRAGRDNPFEEVDLTRTVGRFGHTHPVPLVSGTRDSPMDTVRAVREALRAVPTNGLGWQLLRQGADPVPAAPVDIEFSYRAATACPQSSVFTVVGAADGEVSGSVRRQYPVELAAAVTQGELRVSWTYGHTRYPPEVVERLAERYLHELRALMVDGHAVDGTLRTPSDFPLARVDQAQLDELLGRL